jgi:alpha-beta hydrolase superfamily lysophospholipase
MQWCRLTLPLRAVVLVLALTGACLVADAVGPAAPVRAGVPVGGSSLTPEAALERLFTTDQIDPDWFTPEFLAQVPASQVQSVLAALENGLGAFQGVQDDGQGGLVILFERGTVPAHITLDDQGRIAGLLFGPPRLATPPQSSVPSPSANEEEVSFAAGPDTIYGSLLLPPLSPGQRLPAAVIIAGSGPTDRNGNSTLLPGETNTLLNFAHALAADGVISLRYDKLGTGETGLGSYTGRIGDLGFEAFVDTARAAYDYLKTRPEVDPQRMVILGHSEGALIALVLADRLKNAGEPRAIVLAAPPGQRYLDLIRGQFAAQAATAQDRGAVSPDQAAAALDELDRLIADLRQTGQVPDVINTPSLRQVFNPANAKFLAEADRYDPRALAEDLPPGLPMLLLRGTKDEQVSVADTQAILEGRLAVGSTDVERAELADVDHVFKEVPGEPNPQVDYVNPGLPFSHEAVAALGGFISTYVTGGSGS